MEVNTNNKILISLCDVLPYLSHLFDDAVSFGVTDIHNYIKVQISESLSLKLKIGDSIPQGGAAFEAIKTGKILIKDVPREVYGVPFRSYAIPIKDELGKIAGCFVLGKSLARRNELTELTTTLSSALNHISNSVNTLSTGVHEVLNKDKDILLKVQEAVNSSNDTDDILKFLQGIASQTNLLGLNAAIEASRAGEAGKGFKIVSSEIRKLSASTNDSIKEIDRVLKTISASINTINEKITESNLVFEDQVLSLHDIAESIKELDKMSNTLQGLSEKI